MVLLDVFHLSLYDKQLLNEAEYDIKNYPDRGQCYLSKPKAEADNIDQGLDSMRKPNPIIVLLYIQNSHTKMQAKCGSKKTHAINLAKLCYFVIFVRFEVVTSSVSNDFFWTPPPIVTLFGENDATAARY